MSMQKTCMARGNIESCVPVQAISLIIIILSQNAFYKLIEVLERCKTARAGFPK